MAHTHLTESERYDIYEAKAKGQSITRIAQRLNRSKSTISRECRRNRGLRGYRPNQAHGLARQRLAQKRGGKSVCKQALRRCYALIRQGHSPAQAAGRSALEGHASISHEALYTRIYADKHSGGRLWRHLRCQKKHRKRYGSGRQRRGKIPNRMGIEGRPAYVEKRASIGHWEGDLVIGRNQKGCLITLVERKTGYALVRRVASKNASLVAAAIIDMLRPYCGWLKTVTFDNGLEFYHHAKVSAALGATIYFADPYSSWQRGTNENYNGLLRQYFPKRSCFALLKTSRVDGVQKALNERARQRLAWLTPAEALQKNLQQLGVAFAL